MVMSHERVSAGFFSLGLDGVPTGTTATTTVTMAERMAYC